MISALLGGAFLMSFHVLIVVSLTLLTLQQIVVFLNFSHKIFFFHQFYILNCCIMMHGLLLSLRFVVFCCIILELDGIITLSMLPLVT